jgi:serine/threonine protein kinase
MQLTAGARLGPYEILDAVGAGSMGQVYSARDRRCGQNVAIKILTAASGDPGHLRRFELEARAAAALTHPNIVSVYDIGTDAGASYIVSELLDGETLRARLDAVGALPMPTAVDYAAQAARGLAAAHGKAIVHRDLKPENLFITRDGRVKILDFGLATQLAVGAVDTNAGMVLGTIGYMSPEQVRGLQIDHRSDIFALGAILYEMLAGQRAFSGRSSADALGAILDKDPPERPLAEQRIPPALAHIVDRCLKKDARARFQAAAEVLLALEGLWSETL